MNPQTKKTAPPYSEAQVRHWLAFLARNMQRHGQTVFLIEQLQPTWLTSQSMLWQYGLLDRLAGGLIIGLGSGLIATLILALPSRSLIANYGNSALSILLASLNIAVLCGLVSGLFGGRTLVTERSQRPIRQIVISAIAGWLVISFFSGVYHGLLFGLSYGLANGLVTGLAGALMGALIGNPNVQTRQILVVETLRWSLIKAQRFALIGLVLGLIGGMGYSLIYRLVSGLTGDFPVWLIYGLTAGLTCGIFSGLIGGLAGEQLNSSFFPNQGIWLSAQSAIRAGAVYGLASGLAVGIIYGLIGGPQILLHGLVIIHTGGGLVTDTPAGMIARLSGGHVAGLRSGLIYGGLYGLIGGLIAALAYGGYACLSHLALRLILWWQGAIPLNYARFLDYAAEELNFLQKVGGGYVFIHRYLLEHFASMEDEHESVRHTSSGVSNIEA